MSEIKVSGMSCNHCAMAVTKALASIDGISGIKIDLKSGVVTYAEEKPVDKNIVKSKIADAGYKVAD
jgi:copper chaperone